MALKDFYHDIHVWLFENGPKFIIGVVLFFAGLWFIKFLRTQLTSRMNRHEVHSSLRPFFLSLSITGLYILLIISTLSVMGYPITIFATLVGALGVAAGLALSGTLQNFAGGVLILLLKPFDIDDHIVAQGQDGRVQSIQLFYTEILTADNKTVIIPNGKLFNEVITNITRQGKRRLDIDIKLNYNADIAQVKALMLTAIKETPDILQLPDPAVGVLALDFDGMHFTVRVWVEPAHFLRIKMALQERIINDIKAAGIKLQGT
jgi:small conductance mechanosensitive channel